MSGINFHWNLAIRLRVIGLLIFFIGTSILSYAQLDVDSLQNVLKSEIADTTRVDVLFLLNRALQENEQQSMLYLRQGIDLSISIKDKRRVCEGYLRLAIVQDYKGDIISANKSLDTVQQQLADFRNPAIELRYFYHRGILQYFEGLYDLAIQNFWNTIRLYEERGDSTGIASCYVNIGNANKELENHSKALEYYLKAMFLYQQIGDEYGAAMAIGNAGNIFRLQGNFDEALKYYEKSLSYNLTSGRREEARIDLVNIGNVYLDRGEYTRGQRYFEDSYQISKELGSERGMQLAIYNIGITEAKTGNYKAAIAHVEEALRMAQRQNLRSELEDTYKTLSEFHEHLGNHQLALEYRKTYEAYRDSVLNENHLNEVKELELKYETEKKDKQIKLLAKEKEINENEISRQSALRAALIGGILLIAIVGLLLIFSIYQRLQLSRKDSEIKEVNFRNELVELEMKALRAQINPHFIFNCLTSINRLIMKGENDLASQYLRKFGKLVRLILENASSEVSLKNELELLEAYVQLEQLRFKRKIVFNINVDPELNVENIKLPAMVLQPFVENAIWHGLMHQQDDRDGTITIEITRRSGKLLFIVQDNGVGRKRSLQLNGSLESMKSKSMGLAITEERLKLLDHDGWSEEHIKVIDLADANDVSTGTRVEISLPLNQD